MSETEFAREKLAPYCTGVGLDIGFGGDPVTPWSINVDRPYDRPNRGKYGTIREHLTVNNDKEGIELPWIKDMSMDFVYSSHCLEDFEDTVFVLESWFRVLRIGGNMVLLLPDEPRYRAHCDANGSQRNLEHVHEEFSLEYIEMCFEQVLVPHDILKTFDPCGSPYSFAIVVQRIG